MQPVQNFFFFFDVHVYYQYTCYTFICLPVGIYQFLDLWLNRLCSSFDSAETGSKLNSVLLRKHSICLFVL